MKQTIGTRELFVLDGSDVLIRGTYHKPVADNSAQPDHIVGDRVGIVFLNSTSPTRAANGDAAVYLAESFATCGYPCFRLDLPGFGDSEGDHPEDLTGFMIRGEYASIASAQIKELVARFRLSGVIIAGHCAGAVSAVFTAAKSKECRGLVLIGPFFHLTQPMTSAKVRRQRELWGLQSRLGQACSLIFKFLTKILHLSGGKELPQNANRPLLGCWKKLASKGLPVLFLKSPDRKTTGANLRAGEFDYLNYLIRIAGRKSQVVVKVTDGASNAFSNRQGRAAVRQHTERWLTACFPLMKDDESVQCTLDSDRDETRRHPGLQENYLNE